MGIIKAARIAAERKLKMNYKELPDEFYPTPPELAAAVLKLIRKLNKNNPTPKSEKEIKANIQEEMTDVFLCLDVLGDVYINKEQYNYKLNRWVERLKESEVNK